MDVLTDFDYIIVGAGSAGCVLANRLSTNQDTRVLLIEAGGEAINPWLHIPVGYFKTMHNPVTDWCLVTEPDEGLAGRCIKWPRGKVLGGSSALNGLLYVRGQAQDFDDWATKGNSGWGYEEVLPYFIKSEDQERGADSFHGVGGPLSVSNIRDRRQICDDFIRSANAVGIAYNEDFNGANQQGVGYFQTTTRGRFRCSTERAYLRGIRWQRRNLKIITKAQVHQIIINKKRAEGVIFEHHQKQIQANLRECGEVILSAGAIASPHLLMLSGIGNPQDLSQHAIEVKHALPGVGGNLQDHLQIRVVYQLNQPTLNDEVNNPFSKVAMGMRYFLCGSGPMAMAASQVAIFTNTPLSENRPDIQFHFQPLSASTPGQLLDSYSGVTLSVCQLRPESRGVLKLRCNDPKQALAIHPNYLATDLDRKTVIAGIRMAREIAVQVPFADYVMAEKRPGDEHESDEQILAAARQIAETIYHPVGTCKMGLASDEEAVVNDRLQVHGIESLRVVDASIMPTITSGNTNAPTIMIAERAADLISDYKRP